jgi:hypothetical protein
LFAGRSQGGFSVSDFKRGTTMKIKTKVKAGAGSTVGFLGE